MHDKSYYEKHKKWCDDYFFLKHRNEARGVGGVFFDYIDTGNYKSDFAYTSSIGSFFLDYVKYIFDKYSKKNGLIMIKDCKWLKEVGMLSSIFFMIEEPSLV